MVKYTTVLRLGTAQTEEILRRFNRSSAQHPVHCALSG
jgi:TnpA family transposase